MEGGDRVLSTQKAADRSNLLTRGQEAKNWKMNAIALLISGQKHRK